MSRPKELDDQIARMKVCHLGKSVPYKSILVIALFFKLHLNTLLLNTGYLSHRYHTSFAFEKMSVVLDFHILPVYLLN